MEGPLSEFKVDPNVRIPRAVQATIDQSEALFQQLYGLDQDPPSGDNPPVPTAGGEQPGLEPDPAPAPSDPVSDRPGSDTPPAGDPPEPQDPPTPPAKPAVREDYKAQYLTLKGKYDAEIGRLNDWIARLTEQLSEAKVKVADLEVRLTAAPPTPELPPLSPEQAEEYGPDLTRFIESRAAAIAKPQIDALQEQLKRANIALERVAQRLDGVSAETAQTATERFVQALDREMTGWREQNTDDEWKRWLLTEHPDMPGTTWQNVLDAARAKNDAARVARVFFAYPNATVARPNAAPAPAAPSRDTRNRLGLETLVQPGRGRTVVPPRPDGPPRVTAEELNKFNQDVMRGRYKNRDADRQAMEDRIAAATAAGTLEIHPRASLSTPY